MKLITRGIVCALASAMPLWALAQSEPSAGADSSFTSLDADQSGALSRDELKSYPTLTKNFDVADADTDGKLSQAEFSALVTKSKMGAEE